MSHSSTSPTRAPRPHTIEVKGARTHNLKNVDVHIPHRTMTVITGLSGSGKTSLAFDTIFADWEAKYLQTFDAYTRQVLGKGSKPPVDYIKGILPSVGMKQKSQPPNPRARVGTTGDIFPYLKLLFGRIGKTYSPISGEEVRRDTISDVVDYIQSQRGKQKVWILSSMHLIEGREVEDTLKIELGKGFTRVLHQEKSYLIEDLLEDPVLKEIPMEELMLVVDRLVLPEDPRKKAVGKRLGESVQAAFFEGKGRCVVRIGEETHTFSDRFEADGMSFLVPSPQLFDPNNPHGACEQCHGFGRCVGIDAYKVVPDPSLSVREGAIAPWRSISMQKWQDHFLAHLPDFPADTPYKKLSKADKGRLWKGEGKAEGIERFFAFLASKTHKVQFRILQARYRGFTSCMDCEGTGLRKEASYVKVGGRTLIELLHMSIEQLQLFFNELTIPSHQEKVAKVLCKEINSRIAYFMRVGLGYLALNRHTHTLSGGEYQRLRLARALASALVDILCILDEPTVGFHPRDTDNLIDVLKSLQAQGNTIVVVEHDEAMMRAADQIIDMGPEAGSRGGEVVFQGTWDELMKDTRDVSHTVRYLTGKTGIPIPKERRKSNHFLHFKGINAYNIEHVNLMLPLKALTVVTGVSGAGKSTLIEKVVYPAVRNHLDPLHGFVKNFDMLTGDLDKITQVELVGQDALGKSSRSNPATYTKAYDGIRKLFALQPLAKERGYTPGLFSFNISGGRCEPCMGEGMIKVEMQFTSDVSVVCESCHGKRFKQEVLDVTFREKTIEDILRMTVEDSIQFFADYPSITHKLAPLQEVGLGYLKLGQSSSTFSGGEAQRVKLSAYLGKENTKQPALFIFDEPTTGLHFHDIAKLIKALQKLVAQGHSVVVIEHNGDLIKCADWVIDMGPEGGDKGGKIVFEGTPEQMITCKDGHTARYLKKVFEGR